MKLGKKGFNLNTGIISSAILAFVLVTVLFLVGAELIPEVQTAGDELNATGAPLAGMFASDGVAILIIMAALVMVVVGAFLRKKFGK